MKILVSLLSLFFILLILNEMINLMKKPIIEGASNNGDDFQSYPKDPLILAQQNAGNIKFLKNRFTQVDQLTKEISQQNIDTNTKLANMQQQIKTNADSINALVQAQKDTTNQLNDAQSSVTG